MVVLEGGGNVVTIGSNQYLQPDYLAPLPTTLDSKKSPLALLAQTCSQIGADSSAVKPTLKADLTNCSNKKTENSKSPLLKPQKSTSPASVTESRLAYKPYEINVLSRTSSKSEEILQRPNSKNNSNSPINYCENADNSKLLREKSKSPQNSNMRYKSDSISINGKISPASDLRKTISPVESSQRDISPGTRSGMEGLTTNTQNESPLGYKSGSSPFATNVFGQMCCPPGMEQNSNPAFRSSFASSYSHHAAMMAAVAAQTYSSGISSANHNPYINYQRIKTASGQEAIVPVCKDPYCPGCPYSAHSQQMIMGAACPNGCTQCDHQKYGLAMAASLGTLPTSHPYAAAAAQMRSPYVCSWIAGDSYCGKRFNTSDELFTHLRTHTGNLSDPANAAAALAQSQAQSILGSLFSPSASMQRGYPTPPLSPLSAARYHPYNKPGGLSSSGMSFSAAAVAAGAFNPATAAALGSYYGPYAIFGQRMGSAAVNQ